MLLLLVGLFVLAFGAGAMAQVMPGGNMANKATGGGLEGAAIGKLGDTTVTPPLSPLLNLPALHIDQDAEGRVVMDLPGLKLVGKPKGAPAAPGRGPSKLPKTGANVGDIFALGMAALSGGGILVRRVKLSLAS
jgi:LPXTG-motif cell wall-anchored protein